MPATHFVSTVLPAPLSPHSAVTWLDGSSRSTWYRAWTGPKCLSSPLIWSSDSELESARATAAVIASPIICPAGKRRRRRLRRRRHCGLPSGNVRSGAGAGAGLAAQSGLVDELVLDHRRSHVGLVDPDRNQQRCRLLVARHTLWRRGRAGDQSGGRRLSRAK